MCKLETSKQKQSDQELLTKSQEQRLRRRGEPREKKKVKTADMMVPRTAETRK